MKKNILVIVSRYSRNKSDPGDFVTELSESIIKKGFNVCVLAPHDYTLKFFEEINDIKIFRFPYFFPFKFQRLAYGPGILDNVKKSLLAKIQIPLFIFFELVYSLWIVKKQNINIIHSHWIIPQGLIGAICSKLFNIVNIATVHGSDINMMKQSKILKFLSSFILKNSRRITVNSEFTKELMFSVSNKKYHDKVITIPMGVDTKRFYPSDQNILKKEYSEEDLLIFVGRLIDWKGTVFLVEAMKDVVRIFPKTKLLIIGDGPEKNNLITKINELGLQSNIIFIGQIKNTEIRKYYSAADIFIIPSIIVSGHTEGLGVVTIEAMACGTSVIGSDVGGIPDVIQNEYNGFLVSEKSSKELAQKIIKLLSNNDMQNKFIRNGIKLVDEKFNWDVISNQFIKIFY